MKKKYFFVIFFLVLAIFFVINTSTVNAKMYKILDSEGNVIRLTNNPALSMKEKEEGYTVSPPPPNEQEIKQEALSKSNKYDFRETNWGMSKEQVKVAEKNKIEIEDEEVIAIGRVEIDKKECIYVYHFLEDKLYRAGYGFMEKHTNKNLYINDYESLK